MSGVVWWLEGVSSLGLMGQLRCQRSHRFLMEILRSLVSPFLSVVIRRGCNWFVSSGIRERLGRVVRSDNISSGFIKYVGPESRVVPIDAHPFSVLPYFVGQGHDGERGEDANQRHRNRIASLLQHHHPTQRRRESTAAPDVGVLAFGYHAGFRRRAVGRVGAVGLVLTLLREEPRNLI